MASAKKCDRCGKFFENAKTHVELKTSSNVERDVIFDCRTSYSDLDDFGTSYSDLDLCPDCIESFKHWWANETVIPITKKRGKKNGADRETT